MINLLPRENKETINKEYLRRLLVVAGVFLFFDLLVGLIFLLPVFYSLESQKVNFERQLELSEALLNGGQSGGVYSFVTELRQKTAILEKGYNDTSKKSVVLRRILGKKIKGISLDNFAFGKTKVVVRGFSKERNNLLEFVRLLEEDEVLKSVYSPTTNLLKSKDIDFSIEIDL